MDIIEIMRCGPVIPVLVIDRADEAVPLARALVDGGVRVLEVTLRTPAAMQAVARIAREVEGAIVGVGTLTRPEHFAQAVAAGAAFAVSPGLTPDLARAARDSGLPFLPGCMTPSEVIAATGSGFAALKLFPAQQAGGVDMLRALAGPFGDVRFCPTGGVTPDNAPAYLALDNVACVGGSWLAPRQAVAAHDWGSITQRAREAAALGAARRGGA